MKKLNVIVKDKNTLVLDDSGEKGDIIEEDDSLDATTKALKKNYEKKKTEKSAKATMIVKNVAADESRYMPYYSPNISLDDYTVPLLEERKYYFYPLFENQLDLEKEDGDDIPELSLRVPEENIERSGHHRHESHKCPESP